MIASVSEIKKQLPYLRRYARAMSGSQTRGDRIAEEVLLSILKDTLALSSEMDLRVALFRAIQDVDTRLSDARQGSGTRRTRRIDLTLDQLAKDSRDAFLLSAFEAFSHQEIAAILRLDPGEIAGLIATARHDLSNMLSRRVLIIEDELRVAQEITEIVTAMGHTVIANAPTTEDAIEIAAYDPPDLIVSDIQLANHGSGIRAVTTILGSNPLTPVVYVTGFPERLLTGKGPEPAFLVTKPYTPDQVRSAVSQAVHFA